MLTMKEKMSLQVEALIGDRVREVWGYVRENADCLDSELACKKIRQGIDLAAMDLVSAIEELSAKYDALNTELRSAKGSLSKAKADIAALEAKLPKKKKEADGKPASAK